ncbi:hypothetical protein EDC56_2940 [Sinobacterium caligoides]|uniref:ApbE family protein n=1 Tax=Sinobacterium caligoides TaxID=933926 RepID=A0A3N2DKH0_9GAMM|nr:(Na+)-NQR maturation NqrM [Sinobacterium caligoides]ROS00294.1 hypothetical protein EDC56_2940 [Sinobacterium caligoides]
MTIFLLTLGFVIVMVVGMAVGSIAGRGPIKGSCGGMSALGIDTACDICGGNPKKCDEEQERVAKEQQTSTDFYDADK